MQTGALDIIPDATKANAVQPQGFDWLSVAGGALSLLNQQRLAETNLKRAKQGLSPITIEQIPGATPTVQVGVERSTRDLLALGGAGVLALVVIRMIAKRRR